VAEELDADFASVRAVNAANGTGPKEDVYGTPAGGEFIQLSGASTPNGTCGRIRGKLTALMRSGCHLVPMIRGPG